LWLHLCKPIDLFLQGLPEVGVYSLAERLSPLHRCKITLPYGAAKRPLQKFLQQARPAPLVLYNPEVGIGDGNQMDRTTTQHIPGLLLSSPLFSR
jgi:hypothetical protein